MLDIQTQEDKELFAAAITRPRVPIDSSDKSEYSMRMTFLDHNIIDGYWRDTDKVHAECNDPTLINAIDSALLDNMLTTYRLKYDVSLDSVIYSQLEDRTVLEIKANHDNRTYHILYCESNIMCISCYDHVNPPEQQTVMLAYPSTPNSILRALLLCSLQNKCNLEVDVIFAIVMVAIDECEKHIQTNVAKEE